MGVDGGFSCFISFNPKQLALKDNPYKYVVIDAHSLICRYAIGDLNSKTFIVDKCGKQIAEIYYLFIIALRFLAFRIVPIFVFDGSAPLIKDETVEKRRAAKEKAGDMLKQYFSEQDGEKDPTIFDVPSELAGTDEPDKDDACVESCEDLEIYIKYLKRSFRPNIPNIEFAKLILRWMGLPVVDAPGEADPQCAAIAKEYAHSVIGVITDDIDPLMYASTNILKLPSIGSNYINEFSHADTLAHLRSKVIDIINSSSDLHMKEHYASYQDLDDLQFTQDNLVELGCLMGTDFCPGLKVKRSSDKNRFKTILDLYVKHGLNMEAVLQSMRGMLSKTYINRMMCARETYKTAPIFDPKKMDIAFKKPCIPMIKKLCTGVISEEYLDSVLEMIESAHKNYESLTIGRLAPQTIDKFTSFTSYRARYAREKALANHPYKSCGTTFSNHSGHHRQFPEPGHRIPITIVV